MTKYLINGEEVLLFDGELWMRVPSMDNEDVSEETESDAEEDPVPLPDQRTVRKCSSCGKAGHTARTCPQAQSNRDDDQRTPAMQQPEPTTRTGRTLNPTTLCAIAALRDELTPQQVADKCETTISNVYQIRSKYKGQIEHGRVPASKEPADDEKSDGLSQDVIDQIQDLRDDDFTTSEIADELGLRFADVASVPARNAKGEFGSVNKNH